VKLLKQFRFIGRDVIPLKRGVNEIGLKNRLVAFSLVNLGEESSVAKSESRWQNPDDMCGGGDGAWLNGDAVVAHADL
jgi:hypothetical protein